ncbi:DUF3352 domain-containing protein [Aegicerativicinus sediminis]|uniref:DUF3352 domain-containing protein n=1 Tax=Aegicerativicinus sediminis TaxID=2893202 RepID=UPI001E497064|nr:DUF3352 domain-containing protein [Aegicerativicinus sediminis]
MQKSWLAILALTIFLSCQETENNDNQLIDYLPTDATFILTSSNVDSLSTLIARNALISTEKDSTLFSTLRTLSNTIKPDSIWGKMYLAISKNEPNGQFFTLVYNTDSLIFQTETLKSFSSETIRTSKHTIDQLQLDSTAIYHYKNSSNNVFTNDKKWLDESIAKFPFNNRKYRDQINTTSSDNSIILKNLKLNSNALKTNENDTLPLRLADELILELSISENSVYLNGIAVSDSLSNSIQNLNNHTKPRENKFAQIAPYDITFAQSFAFNDYEHFQMVKPKMEIDSFSSQTNELPNIVEFAVLKKSESTTYALHSLDIDATADAIGLAFPSENYRDIDLYQTPREFNAVLKNNKYVQLDSISYCTKLGDFILVSNHGETLKDYISNFQNETSLANSENFQEIMEHLSDESSLFLYFKGKELGTFLIDDVDYQFSLKENQSSAIQFINENNFSHVHAVFGNAPKSFSRPQVKEIWQKNLDAPLLTEPQFLKNHRNGGMDIAVQDMENNLYLISSTGTVYWKKQIDGRILGTIKQIDVFKNGRLQMAFATPKTLYVLDRTGRNVSGFPVNLQHPVTQPLSVFDYDNNKNYRLMLTQGKFISLFDKKGKLVRGFNYKVADEINTAPQHFRIGRKDYIVFHQGNTLELLTRRGEKRIPVKSSYNFSNNPVLNYEDNFAFTTKEGALVQVDQKGGISSANLSLAEDHYVTSTNRTLVTLSDNILKIKDNEVELPFGRYTAPIIFYINNKIYVTTTDLQTSKVYLFDSQGKTISDFPVYGSSSADLQNIDKDSALEIVVKGGENSILLYELN